MTQAPALTVVQDSCPLCASRSFESLPVPTRWIGEEVFAPLRGKVGLCRCRSCDFIYASPYPGAAILSSFYSGVTLPRTDAEHLSAGEQGGGEKAAFLISYMAEKVKGRRLLDYGSALGSLVRRASQGGWDAWGYDTGAAYEHGKASGLQMIDRLEAKPDGSFDAILMNQVFEHIEDRDGLLRSLRRLLSPGGMLFVACPNVLSLRARLTLPSLIGRLSMEERYRAFPIHLSYFSPRTLPRFFAKNGYKVEAVDTLHMGLNEMFLSRGAGDDDESSPASRPPSQGAGARSEAGASGAGRRASLRGRAKAALKRAYFGAGLGENVLVAGSR